MFLELIIIQNHTYLLQDDEYFYVSRYRETPESEEHCNFY